jgi:hypothetical protein
MRLYTTICTQGWSLVLAALLGASYSPAEAQEGIWAAKQVPAAEIACRFVGRAFTNNSGVGEILGYFTSMNGVGDSDTVFNGPPSETTAFFTFRALFSLKALPLNGDVQPYIVSAGTFDIYYNQSPNGDWSDPESFSAGQLIAHFMRPESLFIRVLQSDLAVPGAFEAISVHDVTEILASSQSFTFRGHRYDLGDLVPGGITLYETISNTLVPGVTDPDPKLGSLPYGLPLAGHGVAVARTDQDQQ